jgi:hypothetical protein
MRHRVVRSSDDHLSAGCRILSPVELTCEERVAQHRRERDEAGEERERVGEAEGHLVAEFTFSSPIMPGLWCYIF